MHLLDMLDTIHGSTKPDNIAIKQALRDAIHKVAPARDGIIHISYLRPHLPSTVRGPAVGAFFNAMVKQGYLEKVDGFFLPNGDTESGNASKPTQVYKLAKQIPAFYAPVTNLPIPGQRSLSDIAGSENLTAA